MSLHEAIGAMVGAGIGAMRADLDADDAARIHDTVSEVLVRRPLHLPDVLAERLPPGEALETALRGATLGVSALPLWDRLGLSRTGPIGDRQLVQQAVLAALGRPEADRTGWPAAERLVPYYLERWHPPGFVAALPQDDGVLVGDVAALEGAEADAVVSLCRMGARDVPEGVDHVEAWLVDEDDPAANPNLAFVLRDVASTIGNLRDEGERVFVHCVRADSRTPIAAAAYLALRFGLAGSDALAITDLLVPGPGPKPYFRRTLTEVFPAR
jgi:hypothetical protein